LRSKLPPELGRAEELLSYLVHIEADPIRKGLLIAELIDRHGWTQREIAEKTGWSRTRISELYKAVKGLIPELLERALKGEIRASTALELSKLPPEEQRAFIDERRITLSMVQERRRELAVSREIINLLTSPLIEGNPGSSESDILKTFDILRDYIGEAHHILLNFLMGEGDLDDLAQARLYMARALEIIESTIRRNQNE